MNEKPKMPRRPLGKKSRLAKPIMPGDYMIRETGVSERERERERERGLER